MIFLVGRDKGIHLLQSDVFFHDTRKDDVRFSSKVTNYLKEICVNWIVMNIFSSI